MRTNRSLRVVLNLPVDIFAGFSLEGHHEPVGRLSLRLPLLRRLSPIMTSTHASQHCPRFFVIKSQKFVFFVFLVFV